MSDHVEKVAIAMWIDYVKSASPPVEWHSKHDLKHWTETATERDREAWRRSARVAISTLESAKRPSPTHEDGTPWHPA